MKIKLASLFSALVLSTTLAFADPEEKIAETQMININSATAEEMDEGMKGVSMKKAEAIVKYREENGEFENVEDITQVKGVGDKTLEWNKDILEK